MLDQASLNVIFLDLGEQSANWRIVVLDTEEELNFIKHAIGFLYSSYSQNYTLGGSTVSDPGLIDYSKYIKNASDIYFLVIIFKTC